MMFFTLAVLGKFLYGLSLSVLSYRAYVMQLEILKGQNSHAAFTVGLHQALLGTTMLATIGIAMPEINYGSSILWLTALCLPFIAAMASGWYEHIKQTLQNMDKDEADKIFLQYDNAFNKVPKPIFNVTKKFLNFCNQWLGAIFMGVQLTTFAVMLPSPNMVIGVTGLAYLGIAKLRSKHYLPIVISTSIEKLDYWVEMLSGVFLRSTVLRLTAVLRITYELFINIVVPKLVKNIVISNSEFMRFAKLSKEPIPKDRLQSDISIKQLDRIMNILPAMPSIKTNEAISRIDQLNSDFLRALAPYMERIVEIDEIRELPRPDTSNMGYLRSAKTVMAYYLRKNYQELRKIALFNEVMHAQMNDPNKYSMTVMHMSHVPDIILPIEFDFAANKSIIAQHYAKIAACNRENILNSATFKGLSEGDDAQKIVYWRSKLNIPNASDDEVLAKYFAHVFSDAYEKINTGDVGDGKKVSSLEIFQNKGMHVLHKAVSLIQSKNKNNVNTGYDMLVRLALQSGEMCPAAIYYVVFDLYDAYVFKPLCAEKKIVLTASEKLALYFQERRQELFEQMYCAAFKIQYLAPMLAAYDMKDLHVRVGVTQALGSLNLKENLNAQSELISQGIIAELIMKLLAYGIARSMMSLPHGYSPQYLLSHLLDYDVQFIRDVCLLWSNKFNDATKNHIHEILIADEYNSKMKLYTLMLYDLHMMNCPEKVQMRIAQIVSSAKDPEPKPISPVITYAWIAGKTAYDGITFGCTKITQAANYARANMPAIPGPQL